jgi:uncharacterized protein (DUF488 family)
MAENQGVYTIGHSNHTIEDFIAMTEAVKIDAIADVRSTPFSRRNPQFNREPLAATLRERNIAYAWLGDGLGARPIDPSLRRPDGGVDFASLAASEAFVRGIERVINGAKHYRLALMCAERDPINCHRAILVGRHLAARGVVLRHVLGDGLVVSHQMVEQRIVRQAFPEGLGLFAEEGDEQLQQAYDKIGKRMTRRGVRG